MSAHTEGYNNLYLLSAYLKCVRNTTGIFWSDERSKRYFICVFWTAHNNDENGDKRK